MKIKLEKCRKNYILLFLSMFFLLFVVNIYKIQATIAFEDVTEISGVSHTSRSFGAAWGDFNGDGRPDLFTNNHQTKPCLYLNKGNGTFEDVYDEFIDTNKIFIECGSTWCSMG